MMVIPIFVEITVKRKTRRVMEFAAMTGFHASGMMAGFNASKMTVPMKSTKIVMANAFLKKIHVMMSV